MKKFFGIIDLSNTGLLLLIFILYILIIKPLYIEIINIKSNLLI